MRSACAARKLVRRRPENPKGLAGGMVLPCKEVRCPCQQGAEQLGIRGRSWLWGSAPRVWIALGVRHAHMSTVKFTTNL